MLVATTSFYLSSNILQACLHPKPKNPMLISICGQGFDSLSEYEKLDNSAIIPWV
jgi:hypothetical protein